jgi:hypothetical protein
MSDNLVEWPYKSGDLVESGPIRKVTLLRVSL